MRIGGHRRGRPEGLPPREEIPKAARVEAHYAADPLQPTVREVDGAREIVRAEGEEVGGDPGAGLAQRIDQRLLHT